MKPAPGRAGRRGLGLVCALAFTVLWPGAAATGELAWGDIATPLRIVNLNPFRLLYGVPGSLGAHVMTPGSSELIASMDMASHLIEASSGAERVLIDGETYRQGLAMRHGFGDGWEYLFEVSALSHRAGAFDGFIETWHDVFHLPQGDRDRAPRDRLALFYANGGKNLLRYRPECFFVRGCQPRGGLCGAALALSERRPCDPGQCQASNRR